VRSRLDELERKLDQVLEYVQYIRRF